MKEPAFIIGNGTSRFEFDLMSIKDAGTVFGCNAIYRDFKKESYVLPHYLIAIDPGITTEIECSDFPAKRVIIPPLEEQWEPAVVNPNRPRSNAGTNAALEAMKMGHKQLIFIGFDFLQVHKDTTQSISNMYDGTDNYGMDTRARPSDNFGRISYLQWIVRENPDVTFIFAYPETQFKFPVFGDNIFVCTFDQIMDNLNG